MTTESESRKPIANEPVYQQMTTSRRRLTWGRKVLYRFGVPVAMLIPRLLWSSYRIVRVIGEDIIPSLLAENKIFLPTYWHQHHLLCVKYLGRFYSDGLKLGFLISPSVGGELGANVVTRSVRT